MSEQDGDRRRAKKTRSIEIRVSDKERDTFLARCRTEGRSASEVLREAMARYAETGRVGESNRRPAMIASIVSVSVLALATVQPGAGEPSTDRPYMIAEFDRYDLNADRRLTVAEYVRAHGSVGRMQEETVVSAGLAGMVFGAFVREGFGGHAHLIFEHPQQIDTACWQALQSEVSATLASNFQRLDLDGDGVVEPDEFGEARLIELRARFEQSDHDGDGVLTSDDVRAMREQMRALHPRNASSQATQMAPDSFNEDGPDFMRICAPQINALEADQSPSAGDEADRPGGGEPPTESYVDLVYGEFDADGDGEVTFAEYASGHERAYASTF